MSQDTENQLRQESEQLQEQLTQAETYKRDDYPELAKRAKILAEVITLLDKKQILIDQRVKTKDLLNEQETDLATLAQSEIEAIDQELTSLEDQVRNLLQPPTISKVKNCFIEIRAGVGGSEASLFAADLYRMYTRFAEKQNWKVDLISQNPSDIGGFKEIIVEVTGRDSYQLLQVESGVHRVQRIPVTESQGRIHTSTASVAVIPKAEATDLVINNADLRIDTYRSTGHGGQSVNTTDSAVRITHIPSGLVVTCQDEKSQFKNREKALSVLRSRLLRQQIDDEISEISQQRQKLIGKAMRNEKIRTYNFPQDRLTDHRINFSTNNLNAILAGDLMVVIEKLQAALD